ncbi:MAG: hypothetical protein R2680_13500 [Nitrososphaeraceae archaeon]
MLLKVLFDEWESISPLMPLYKYKSACNVFSPSWKLSDSVLKT